MRNNNPKRMHELTPAIASRPPGIGPGRRRRTEHLPFGFLHRLTGEEVLERGGHLQHDMLDAADPSVGDQRPRLVGPVLEVPAIGNDHLFARGVGSGHQVSGVGGCGGQRLFHQQMAAFGQRSHSVLVVQHVRRRDDHAVHRDLIQHGAIVLESGGNFEFALQLGEFRELQGD